MRHIFVRAGIRRLARGYSLESSVKMDGYPAENTKGWKEEVCNLVTLLLECQQIGNLFETETKDLVRMVLEGQQIEIFEKKREVRRKKREISDWKLDELMRLYDKTQDEETLFPECMDMFDLLTFEN